MVGSCLMFSSPVLLLQYSISNDHLLIVSGDNKPIWMHAEEKEENKVKIGFIFSCSLMT